jgi:putative iron-regulated protein
MRKLAAVVAFAAVLATGPGDVSAQGADRKAVIGTYADIAQAMYEDSLTAARKLRTAVDALVATPSEMALSSARDAWLAARVPYQQSEVYRFGNAIVDEWEGRVNAWPLDEGLIDYVDGGKYGQDSDENPWYTANVVAHPTLKIGGKTIDAKVISWRLLRSLQEAGGVEANVATGYHAIEFLLWGQDLNGTGPGAGTRPWTDYAKGAACTNANCERRAQYLSVATQLLVDDLAWMARQWRADGEARSALLKDADAGVAAIATGIGSLSYGELAGERMKLGLMLHDPEEEHDCFSDNTHNSHYYNVVGMQAVYAGVYRRIDGREVKGTGLGTLVAATSLALDVEMRSKLAATGEAMAALKKRAETVEHYDQMLADGNAQGNAAIQTAIDRLADQTKTLERIVVALKLDRVKFEGSDSLDAPEKVEKKK